mgnify:CR=1 FL=1
MSFLVRGVRVIRGRKEGEIGQGERKWGKEGPCVLFPESTIGAADYLVWQVYLSFLGGHQTL